MVLRSNLFAGGIKESQIDSIISSFGLKILEDLENIYSNEEGREEKRVKESDEDKFLLDIIVPG